MNKALEAAQVLIERVCGDGVWQRRDVACASMCCGLCALVNFDVGIGKRLVRKGALWRVGVNTSTEEAAICV